MEHLENTAASGFPASPGLFATVVRLRALERGNVAAAQGHQAHAAFLEILRTVDAELAAQLHGAGGRQPFTVSPLHGFRHAPEDGRVWVTPDDDLWTRFTLLDSMLFRTVTAHFLQGTAQSEIQIGPVRFLATSLVSTSGSDSWAGYTSFGQLAGGGGMAGGLEALRNSATLIFASPTAFSFGKRKIPLPLPDLVFGSLLKKWNTFSPVQLPVNLLGLFREQLVISEVRNLNTQMLDFGRYKEKGFTGRVTFEALGHWGAEELRALNALAGFAFYAGVGYKTTMGMGLTRRIIGQAEGR